MQRIPYDGPGKLYVGDLSDGRNAPDGIDRIVNVSQRTYEDSRMIHLPLEDSDDAREIQYRHAIETATRALRDGLSVLVHCAVGANRGPCVAAGVLYRVDRDLGPNPQHAARDSFRRIESVRPIANLSPHFRKMLVRFTEDKPLPNYRPSGDPDLDARTRWRRVRERIKTTVQRVLP